MEEFFFKLSKKAKVYDGVSKIIGNKNMTFAASNWGLNSTDVSNAESSFTF